jgi:hypothetical protein
MPKKGKQTKWNASNIATVLLTVGSLSDAMRHLLYVLMNNAAIGELVFVGLLAVWMVGALVCIVESFLTIGLAWIDIADNAEKLGSADSKFRMQR